MGVTARANRANFAVGLAPQTAKGAGASSANARIFAAESVAEDPQRGEIFPQGSTGTLFNKATHRNVTLTPILEIMFQGAREVLPTLLEMMSFGKITVGAGQFTEALDTNNNLSTYTFSGVRPGFNTGYTTSGGAILYVSIATNVINVYKDSARTALVMSGAAAVGTVVLAEQNSSGISGTVACTSATPTNNATITVTLDTLTINFANTPQAYWTCFVDDGKKLRTLTDCVLKSITFSCQDRGPLQISCVIWAMGRSVGATALSAVVPGATIYAHNGDLVFRTDAGGTPVTQDPTRVSFTFDRDCAAIMGTSATPQDIYSRLIQCSFNLSFEPTQELDTLLELYDSYDEVDMKFTNGGKLFSVLANKVKMRNPPHPGFSGDDPSPVEIEMLVTEEMASSPGAALTITVQP